MTLRDPGYVLVGQLQFAPFREDGRNTTHFAYHKFNNGYRVTVVIKHWSGVPPWCDEYRISVHDSDRKALPIGHEFRETRTVFSLFEANLMLRDIAELE